MEYTRVKERKKKKKVRIHEEDNVSLGAPPSAVKMEDFPEYLAELEIADDVKFPRCDDKDLIVDYPEDCCDKEKVAEKDTISQGQNDIGSKPVRELDNLLEAGGAERKPKTKHLQEKIEVDNIQCLEEGDRSSESYHPYRSLSKTVTEEISKVEKEAADLGGKNLKFHHPYRNLTECVNKEISKLEILSEQMPEIQKKETHSLETFSKLEPKIEKKSLLKKIGGKLQAGGLFQSKIAHKERVEKENYDIMATNKKEDDEGSIEEENVKPGSCKPESTFIAHFDQITGAFNSWIEDKKGHDIEEETSSASFDEEEDDELTEFLERWDSENEKLAKTNRRKGLLDRFKNFAWSVAQYSKVGRKIWSGEEAFDMETSNTGAIPKSTSSGMTADQGQKQRGEKRKQRSQQQVHEGEEEDDEDDEGERQKPKEVFHGPPDMTCDLCRLLDVKKDNKVIEINRTESEFLSLKYKSDVHFICRTHYKQEIDFKFGCAAKVCGNPLKIKGHKCSTRLKVVDIDFAIDLEKFTSFSHAKVVCPSCYSKLQQAVDTGKSQPSSSQETNETPTLSQFSNFSEVDEDMREDEEESKMKAFKDLFEKLKLSPLKPSNLSTKGYFERKWNEAEEKGRELFNLPPRIDKEKELIQNIKFTIQGKNREETVKILSVLPLDFSYSRYKEELGVGRRIAEIVKEYQQTGIIRERKERFDKTSTQVINQIKDFYLSPGVSRAMAGTRNKIMVKLANGGEEDLQKYVLLHTIEEAHQLFVKETGIEIGVSTFFNSR